DALENAPETERQELVGGLSPMTRHEDADVAAFAITLLGRLAGSEHYDEFVTLFQQPCSVIRAAAVDALVRSGNKQAVSQINRALQDSAPIVRRAAAHGMATVHSPRSLQLLEKALCDDEPIVRNAVAYALSRIDATEIPESLGSSLCEALQAETDPATIEYLLTALGKHGADDTVPVLLYFAQQDDARLQQLAVTALKRRRSPLTIPFFQQHLTNSAAIMRRAAVDQLALLKVQETLPTIREMLRMDPDESVRAACARALGDFQDKPSRAKLEEAVYDERVVRCQAVIALGRLGESAAVPTLLSMLRDVAPEIRYHTCIALSLIKPTDIEENLFRLLEDDDEMVRRGAETALKEIGVSTSQVRSRRLRKTLTRIAAVLAPSAIADAVPGGMITLGSLGLAIISCVVGLIWWSNGGSSAPMVPIVAGDVQAVASSPDGKRLCVMRERNIVDLWNVETGELIERFQTSGTILGAVIPADAKEVLLFDQEKITRRPIGEQTPPSSELPTAQLAGRFLWVTTNPTDNTMQVFQRHPGGVRMTTFQISDLSKSADVVLKTTSPKPGVVSPNGAFVAVPSTGSDFDVFVTSSGKNLTIRLAELLGKSTPAEVGNIGALAFSDDQKFLAVSTTAKKVLILNLDTMKPAHTVLEASPDMYTLLSFRPGTHDLVAISRGGHVGVTRKEFTEEEQFQLEGPDYLDRIAVSADAGTVSVAEEENSEVWVFDVAERQQRHHLID
ncbi:MAG: HEAT repeat domain-containing protein, partial [Planctomycetaceae bacterium]|nr:HEAT repeat domain-containing protein [Planctomycetaceae bacterium]